MAQMNVISLLTFLTIYITVVVTAMIIVIIGQVSTMALLLIVVYKVFLL
jgi:hypothetical protein